MCCDSFAGDGLDEEAGDVERLRVASAGFAAEGMDGHALDRGDVVEGYGFAQEAEDVAAAGPAQGAVLEVRVVPDPLA